MTFIQPTKTISLIKAVITGLATLCVLGTFGLIALYNNVVNVNHNIASAEAQLDTIGAQNTLLNNQIVALLGSADATSTALADGLVEEKNPEYFQTNQQQWAFASQP